MTNHEEKKMLKKVLVSVIAAGALTVSLAGVAWAAPPDDPGPPPDPGSGQGPGGLGHPPGVEVRAVTDDGERLSVPDAIDAITHLGAFGPGAYLKVGAGLPACGRGNGPQPATTSCP